MISKSLLVFVFIALVPFATKGYDGQGAGLDKSVSETLKQSNNNIHLQWHIMVYVSVINLILSTIFLVTRQKMKH